MGLIGLREGKRSPGTIGPRAEFVHVDCRRGWRAEFEFFGILDGHYHQLIPAGVVELLAIAAPRSVVVAAIDDFGNRIHERTTVGDPMSAHHSRELGHDYDKQRILRLLNLEDTPHSILRLRD